LDSRLIGSRDCEISDCAKERNRREPIADHQSDDDQDRDDRPTNGSHRGRAGFPAGVLRSRVGLGRGGRRVDRAHPRSAGRGSTPGRAGRSRRGNSCRGRCRCADHPSAGSAANGSEALAAPLGVLRKGGPAARAALHLPGGIGSGRQCLSERLAARARPAGRLPRTPAAAASGREGGSAP